MKERDEELALFLEMRRREKENEKNNLLLLQNSEDLDLSNWESNRGSSTISKVVSSIPPRKTGTEEFLNSENDKSDYDWLISPPDTPLFPTLEKEVKVEVEIRNTLPTALKPRVSNIQVEPASRSKVASKKHAAMPGHGSATAGNRRSSSAGPTSATSRSSTPSARPTLPSANKSSRPSTPTSRATVTSAKPAAPPGRSSTPTRSTSRASTPTTRASSAAPKTSQRSATPNLRSSTPSRALGVSAPPTRPSSASKAGPAAAKNPAPSRGISPSVKSRHLEPSQIPGYSLDAPPNKKTSLPERSDSATRSRPGAPISRPSPSVEIGSKGGKSKRQSSAPSKARPSTGIGRSNQTSMHALSRARFTDADEESPVVIGTKMVERVVNMRKLAPPKNNDNNSGHNNSSGKSLSSSGSSGFGSTLSNKSLDMAMRHMDIRGSIQGNLRPLVTSIPASSVYSVRSSGSSKSTTISCSDSPLATSNTASSEPSVNNNSVSLDGSEVEENEFGSATENSSPISHQNVV